MDDEEEMQLQQLPVPLLHQKDVLQDDTVLNEEFVATATSVLHAFNAAELSSAAEGEEATSLASPAQSSVQMQTTTVSAADDHTAVAEAISDSSPLLILEE